MLCVAKPRSETEAREDEDALARRVHTTFPELCTDRRWLSTPGPVSHACRGGVSEALASSPRLSPDLCLHDERGSAGSAE
ncbi:hypothetical protein PHYPO_G00053780 [Pangasianodon hypophthalmus]|uniref:Uncharacterized protein n=2 Tax=Pangasianodon TaxID=30992 RepID=A0A5N5M7M6_PANHP|nr:hypothetical protein PHYPO_G00053780 [Pangasianodon hypophthalmus]MCI4385943.1 hypothetical protein [Pangasianodon gigas]